MTVTDTTSLSYWLNWRVLLCVIWVLTSIITASFLIWRYESLDQSKPDRAETQQDSAPILYYEEAWRPCIKTIHPIWLLVFRVIVLCLLVATIIVRVSVNGGVIFYYYTQWTFTLVTIYFGFGSLLSFYGCYQFQKINTGLNDHHVVIDAEEGSYLPLRCGETTNMSSSDLQEGKYVSYSPGYCGYVFQIIFQMSAGAVVLTDCVYWIVIFPFLTLKDYDLNFMTVNVHTLNAIALLGDTALNCLPFPWFRISYFVLWTSIYVIFHWIIHACVSIWWPYPFLDLSSPVAPLWYLFVALMHIPCYGIFALIMASKHYFLSKWFSHCYECPRFLS